MTALELFSQPFMQRAMIAAIFVGIAAPAVGTYLVQRRLALLGDGMGHVAVSGVALGLITGTSPLWAALGVTLAGAVLIEVIRERGRTGGDTALALLFYGGLAGGLFLTGLGGSGVSTLNEYLFGSLLSIPVSDVLVTMALGVVLVVLCVGLAPQLFAVSQDPEFARVAGLQVRFYNLLIAVLGALSVVIAMRTVGLLLVSALMVVPVATVQQLTGSFRTTLLGAMGVGLVASFGGLVVAGLASYRATVQPGPTIVLLALAGFVVTWPIGSWLRHRRRLTDPFPAGPADAHVTTDHAHQHGDDCGHLAVLHGDHLDYVHDGHRHAPHGEHYDEH